MLGKYQGIGDLSLSTCLRNRVTGPQVYDLLFLDRNSLRLQVDYRQKKLRVQVLVSEVANWRHPSIASY